MGEGTASLNVWSRELPPSTGTSFHERDARLRQLWLYDVMESAITQHFKNKAGVVLQSLALRFAENAPLHKKALIQANQTLHDVATQWFAMLRNMPGVNLKALPSASEIVSDFLELGHRDVVRTAKWPDWKP